jgi:hypothetical protein
MLQSPPWGEDGVSPTFEICPCCGVEFGYEDCSIVAAKRYRKEWIEKGAKWFEPDKQPFGWDVQTQMDAVPKGFE